MFGKNPVAKQHLDDGLTLRVVSGSPWPTIQGEGPYAGHPAIFIRLHGCSLRCTFCDTNFSNPEDPTISIDDLTQQVIEIKSKEKLVVITGGEPFLQNILPLCIQLKQAGFTVQIETYGGYWLDGIAQVAEIVCSPKTPIIHPMIRQKAIAFKYVISGGMAYVDDDRAFGYVPITATQPGTRPARLALPREDAPVYLSPCDEYDEGRNAFNRQLVGELAMRYGAIAGIQLHKFLDLP